MQWTRQTPATIDAHIQNTFYQGLPHQGEGIDLRIEMNEILYGSAFRKPKGHWVVLRRFDYTQESQFYNQATKEGVGGPPYEYTDTLLRSRRIPAPRSPEFEPLKPGGILEDKLVYYFEYTIKPVVGEEILELDWDDHAVQPTLGSVDFTERYKIERVHPYRLENGNVQYYAVLCQRDEVTYG